MPRPGFSRPARRVVSRRCRTKRLTAHRTGIWRVRYPWHPWFGRMAQVHAVRPRSLSRAGTASSRSATVALGGGTEGKPGVHRKQHSTFPRPPMIWSLRLVTSGIGNSGSLYRSGTVWVSDRMQTRVYRWRRPTCRREPDAIEVGTIRTTNAPLSSVPSMMVDHNGRGHRLHYHLQNEGQQHPRSGTPGDVLRSRRVWLIERVFPECAGCGAEQGSKHFIRRRAVDPIALGQDRGWANSTDKVVANAPGCSPGSGCPV